MQRIKIFSKLLAFHRRQNNIGEMMDFQPNSPGYRITVRRDYLYQDAFDVLAPGLVNERGGDRPDIRDPIRVKMINWAGQNEAGMDGGGIFREFLNEVLKEGFDVNKGLFQVTHNQLIYPNPLSIVVYGSEYYRHYQFLGRMLAKLIQEKQLIELRFAEFFLAQLFGSGRLDNDVELQHMKSFDPILFKHLRSLTEFSNQELDDLQLDFSVVTDEFDEIKKINLKANGSNIRVNQENVQEYVRLYVNYHLRLKFAPMVNAMRKGISEVVNIEWLSMFSVNEIQTLIAGIETVFDVDEMRKHCMCTNIRDQTDQQYIHLFWDVVHNLSADDKTALLKFMTGCSRPPIEGFKEIFPPLGILLINEEHLLPTSATCMNMLKLPKYQTREKLEEKLRYAINSGAGFELI
ncbi:unnamed protein product [Caenorhabditis angaria]|uniref:HECT-type E3 ubiquitin transferase n=1 Tax=Caenorhabditis angaria TaxID=860376 RepID=A0A9P1I9P2_9PELO|nr:unnamed protein product [Caenorhabditis angaria]